MSDDTSTAPTIPDRPARLAYRSSAELRQVDPPGAALRFRLDPTTVTPGGGVGGWQEVAHPKRDASTEWTGTPLRSLTLDVLLDSHRAGDNVEEALRVLTVWGRRQPGRTVPSVLSFVWGPWAPLRFVLNGLTYGDALYDAAGRRTRQAVTVELLEHRAAVIGLTPAQRATPAKRTAAKPGKPSSGPTPAPSGRVHTVRAGETLSSIAARHLGKASRWPEIARLNNLRDPDRLTVGQRLRLPA